MGVQMVGIRHMRVRMPHWRMLVPMAVWPGRHRFVVVEMVAVVMRMCVLVLQQCVDVFVVVAFEQMQADAREHQEPADGQQPSA